MTDTELELPYRLCDVFTELPLKGNQLAVFENGNDLTDAEMQALAREMNLSETTFVLRRERAVERERGVRVRIFTTREELPFAGHPTLGTATMLRSFFPEFADVEEIALELNAGRIPVRFNPERSRNGAIFGVMTQPEPVFGAAHDPAVLAAACGVPEADFLPGALIQTVSTGSPFCIVPIRSLDALGRLQIPPRESAAYLTGTDARFFYFLSQVPGETAKWRARMQFYSSEDPATGSAAGCAIAYLVRHGLVESEMEIHLRQGVEMGRPSDLYLSAKRVSGLHADTIREVRVGGSTVPVAKGLVFLKRFTQFQQA